MKFKLLLFWMLLYAAIISAQSPTQQVSAIQYYFNNDPGTGVAGNGGIINISPRANLDSALSINLPNTLNNGINNLYVRAKDENGRWSMSERRTFIIQTLRSTNITAYQYFFDTDPGIGNNGNGGIVPVSSTSNYNATIAITLPNTLSSGIHNLYIRTKDELDKWSLVERRTFIIQSFATATITAYQYFFDDDPGIEVAGNGAIVQVSPTVNYNSTIGITLPNSLSKGIHILYIRVKDNLGRWSITERRVFLIQTRTTNLTALEYYYDNDPGPGNGNPFPIAAASAFNTTIDLGVPCLGSGTHRIYVRAKDSFGNWSIIERGSFSIIAGITASSITPSGTLTLCPNDSILLSANNIAGIDYQWLLNGNNIAGATSSSYMAHGAGNYSLKTTCSNSFVTSAIVTINVPSISVSITSSKGDSICAGDSTFLSASTASHYSWSSGDTIQTIKVSVTGTYTVTETFASGCSASASKFIKVYPRPEATITAGSTTTFCAGDSVILTTSNGAGYLWSDNETTQSIVVKQSGNYSVQVTNNFGCSKTSAATTVLVNALPAANITAGGPTTFCEGDSVTLTADEANTYLWSDNSTTRSIVVKQSGNYFVTLTNANGCSKTSTITTVTVNSLPAANISPGGALTFCQGGSVVLTASAGNSYLWSNNATTQSIAVTQSGNYYVQVFNAGGCSKTSSSATVTVTASPSVHISANGATTFCEGDSIVLTASSADSYLWSDNSSAQSIIVKQSGKYSVTITNSNGCSAKDSIQISVVPLPAVNASNSGPYCAGDSIVLSAHVTNANSYTWTGPDNFSSSEQNPRIIASSISKGGSYSVNVSNGICIASSQTIVVMKGSPPTFDFSGNPNFTGQAVFPNTGSPSSIYRFEIKYSDSDGDLPEAGYPRMLMDYEGNGIFTNANDRNLLLSALDPTDLDVTDGKIYFIEIAGLAVSANWKIHFDVIDAEGCQKKYGPLNGPDVKVAPNLSVFANDISFSNAHPDLSSNITVSATIRNNSPQVAQDFYVRLKNHLDTTIVYTDIFIGSLNGNSSTTVSWPIVTPSMNAWVPMQVIIDPANAVAESNEFDNQAIRPFVNGNFPLGGGIRLTAQASPSSSCPASNSTIYVCGRSWYFGVAVPLQDSSVAGASVSIQLIQTAQTFTGYTNSRGEYCIPFTAPVSSGNYQLKISITDFTLSGDTNTTFTILSTCNGPDLISSIQLNASEIFVGDSIAGSVTIRNIGALPAVASITDVVTFDGSPVPGSFSTPSLASGSTYSASFAPITFSTPGYASVSAMADATQLVLETNENNNYSYKSIRVCPRLPDLSAGYNGNLQVYRCNNLNFFIGNCTCLPVDSTFNVRLRVSQGETIIGNYSQTISTGVPRDAFKNVSFAHVFPGSGTYQLLFTVDSNNAVTEFNENNNSYSATFTVLSCKPDISLSSCDAIVSPIDPAYPGTITVNTTLYNGGNDIATAPFKVDFELEGTHYPVSVTSSIPEGSSKQISFTIATPVYGCHVVHALADADNDLDELVETNNSANIKLSWDFSTGRFCNNYAMFWDRTYAVGESVSLAVGLFNFDAYRASQVRTKFEVSGPGITGWLNLGFAINSNVAQTCVCPYAATLPNPYNFQQTGTYFVRMTADGNYNYTECNEDNNVLIVPVVVVNTPDYRILSQHIAPSLLNPAVGQPISFVVSYENTGGSDIVDSLNLLLKVDDIPLEKVRTNGLLNNDFNSVPFTSQWSSIIPGIHIVRAIADADHELTETTRLNNEATRAIVVGLTANLHFTQFTPSNRNPVLNEQIDIQIGISNSGPVDCSSDLLLFYVNTNGDTIQFERHTITVLGNGNITLSIPWQVLNPSATVIGTIVNSSVPESNYSDNDTLFRLNPISLTAQAIPACANQPNGSASVIATGGTPPYRYSWSTHDTDSVIIVPSGIYTVMVTDNNNITANTSITINELTDSIPPVFLHVPTDTTIACNAERTSNDSATASDNCRVISITYEDQDNRNSDTQDSGYYNYTIIRTWKATDASNNINTASTSIKVIDNQNPTLSCVGNQYRSANSGLCTYTVLGNEFNPAAINDNCAVLSLRNNYNNASTLAGAVFNKGTTTVIWTVTDVSKNVSTGMFSVTVADNQNPVITCVGNQTRASNSTGCRYTVSTSEFNPIYNDNCPGTTIRNNINNSASLAGAVFNTGITTVIWTVTDASNNTATCSFTMRVTGAPTISKAPTTTSTCQGSNNGTITTYVTGADLSYLWSNGKTTANLSGLAPGTYTYTASNSCGSVTGSAVVGQSAVSSTITGSSTVLGGATSTFSGPSGMANYYWTISSNIAGNHVCDKHCHHNSSHNCGAGCDHYGQSCSSSCHHKSNHNCTNNHYGDHHCNALCHHNNNHSCNSNCDHYNQNCSAECHHNSNHHCDHAHCSGASISGSNSEPSITILNPCCVSSYTLTLITTNSDGCTSTSSKAINVTASATITIYSSLYVTGSGYHPSVTKQALMSNLRVYNRHYAGRRDGDQSHYSSVWNSNNNFVSNATISDPVEVNYGGGPTYRYIVTVPAYGHYLIVGKSVVSSSYCNGGSCIIYTGKKVGGADDVDGDHDTNYDDDDDDNLLPCSNTKIRYNTVLKDQNGKCSEGSTQEQHGSLMVIVAPMSLEFTDSFAYLPLVYESVNGNWSISPDPTVPCGFYTLSDNNMSTAVTDNTLNAIQYTVIDTGSDWTFTNVRHNIRHNGEDRIAYSKPVMINNRTNKPSEIMIYPNPAFDRIKVVMPKFEGKATLCVYDLIGKKISEQPINIISGASVLVDVSQLPQGVYLVTAENKHGKATSRMVKLDK